MRKSSRGSASGAGSSTSTAWRGAARRTSSASSVAGASPSITRPPGAPTTTVVSPTAVNDSVAARRRVGAEQPHAARLDGSSPATGHPAGAQDRRVGVGGGPSGAPTAVSSAT